LLAEISTQLEALRVQVVQQQAQVVQQQAQQAQMVQLLVNDRLGPRSSTTSKQQRDRCGCTRSAHFPSRGLLDVVEVTQRWCADAQQHLAWQRMLCSKRGPQHCNGRWHNTQDWV
jgi:hypothetical protein